MLCSSHQLQKSGRESFSVSGNAREDSLLGYEGLISFIVSRTALLKVCHDFLPLLHYKWCPGTGFSFSSFAKSPYMCLYMFTYQLKIVTGLLWERFQILIFCMVVTCSFPFLPLLHHYALLIQPSAQTFLV